jgi:RNA polymerase sigma-70 factor, ECF subfamily
MEREAETRLVERLLSRDESALREVIAAFGGIVLGMARRVLGDSHLAEEVAQDAFVALWNRPGAYDGSRGSLGAFLVGVTRNKAIDLVRKEESARRTKDALIAEAETTPSASSDSSEVWVEQQDVRSALEGLSEVQREALVLAYFGGRTYREVAEELGIPEGTAKTRLRDGLLRLRETLGTRGDR